MCVCVVVCSVVWFLNGDDLLLLCEEKWSMKCYVFDVYSVPAASFAYSLCNDHDPNLRCTCFSYIALTTPV
jgi:hypothetical protein